jgi:hypothetical protein
MNLLPETLLGYKVYTCDFLPHGTIMLSPDVYADLKKACGVPAGVSDGTIKVLLDSVQQRRAQCLRDHETESNAERKSQPENETGKKGQVTCTSAS